MVTIVITPVAITVKKKDRTKYGYTMNCYFDEYLFKSWTNVFKNIHEASHYATGFLQENFIAPRSVETVIENYHLITGNERSKTISVQGIPYSIIYKPKGKYKLD
jgi:hypothetical protein